MAIKDVLQAVLTFDEARVPELVRAALEAGTEVEAVLNQGLIGAMDEVGRKFTEGDLFVSEMLLAAPAMMAGTIDGVLTSLGYGYSIGLAKVSKYYTLTPLSPTWSAVTVINRKTFDSLPPDLQKVLLDVGRELQQMVCLSTTAEYVLSVDTVDLSGVKRRSLPPADQKKALAACQVVEKEWLKKTGSDGEELLSAIKAAVKKYRSFNVK